MSDSFEQENILFILKSSLSNLQTSIESFKSPIFFVSQDIHQNLNSKQITTIEKSFLDRANYLKAHIKKVQNQLLTTSSIENLYILQHKIQHLSNHFFLSERVFDYYVDILHTRSEPYMGVILKGLDELAHTSLKASLDKIDLVTPTVLCYLDAGQGAAIMSAGIKLWDYQTNPAALIKVVRSAIPLPRLTSILHECGHQVAKITGWNEELSLLIRNTMESEGLSKELSDIWAQWSSEIAADMYSHSLGNFASCVGLSEVLLSISNTMFTIFDKDPHPMAYIRIMLGLVACRLVFGDGPWIDYLKMWQILFPIRRANRQSAKFLMESLPLLYHLCKTILNTKMTCFSGKSLQDIIPWNERSPKIIKNFLNNDFSNFRISNDLITNDPIIILICFRYIQMFGGRSHLWIVENMQHWLNSLGSR